MSPRPGGETDKFGNRYEGAWTIRHALYVLLGRGTSICLEPSGPVGEGVEFVYRHAGETEVHQVKRQDRNANGWNVASLRAKGIWDHLRSHVTAGRTFCFVSALPARALDELADRARRADDAASFEAEWLTEELRGPFEALASGDIYGSAEVAWRMLRGFRVHWHDERDLVRTNAVLAEQVLAGGPGPLTAVGLGQLLVDNLGTTLDAAALTDRLAPYGLRRVGRADGTAVSDEVSRTTRRWAATVERELLRPVIPRQEAARIVEQIRADPRQLVLLVGAAGGGKSSVLHQVFTSLDGAATAVLAFRLDRLGPFDSTHDLGQRVGLSRSPVAALAAVADGRSCVLVVDQLDAVSLASGRIPDAFDAVADLVDEAAAYPDMRVVLACRAFDAKADHRIRRLADADSCTRITVESLTDAQVHAALSGMGLEPARLTGSQRTLLRSPLHLVLLDRVRDQEEALSFHSTRQLFDAFWEAKRRDCERHRPGMRFHEAMSALVSAMSSRQSLSVPYSLLDTDDLAASREILLSEHVCVRDGRTLAFFHESFFDYAFARDWLRRGESLVVFLTGGEQELFRRGQLRQVLDHLRDEDPERFAEEVEKLLTSPEIRYHLKDLTLAVLRGLDEPSSTEWGVVTRVLDTHPAFREPLIGLATMPAWFRRADEEGAVERWLAGADPRERDTAVRLLASVADSLPDRVARLLQARRSDSSSPDWLKQIVLRSSLAGSRSLFDLVLDGVRSGLFGGAERELWIPVSELAEGKPGWAVELLDVLLTEQVSSPRLDPHGRVTFLLGRDHEALRAVEAAAAGAPEEFFVRLVPVLVAVVKATARTTADGWPVRDRQFPYRHADDDPRDLGGALVHGLAAALRLLARQDPARVPELVRGLVGLPYDTTQWLLYQALSAAGPSLADWSAEILLEGAHRLLTGSAENVVWGTREVLLAIGGTLSDKTLGRLEHMLLHLRLPPDGQLSPWHEFTLLTALPEARLSERAARRLGELRRLHGDRRQPDEPEGMTGGSIGPPIASESAQHMSDDQWLTAMRKYSRDETNWTNFTGGAGELALVLHTMTVADPDRFARLAPRIDAGTHPAYGAALLRGLGEAEACADPEPVFAAVRHFAGHHQTEQERWLGDALRKYLDSVPLDLVEMLLECVLGSDGTGTAEHPDRARADDPSRDLLTAGINTVPGSAAWALADLLVRDPDGSRALAIVPRLRHLADVPSLDVRACVARVLHAAIGHDRQAVADAFGALVRGPDHLLASPYVSRLAVALMHGDPGAVRPQAERMLTSAVDAVRRFGGQVAALAAMEWAMPDLLAAVLAGHDAAQRQGAAGVCAVRLGNTGDAALAHHALVRFFHDPEAEVRQAAAEVAAELRGRRLGPHRRTLDALMDSLAFETALPQLLITLERAPDRIDELVLTCVRRFIAVFGAASADLRRRAAADSYQIGELLVRSYVQASSPTRRSEILDLLDELLLLGSYGVAKAISDIDRN